MQKQIKIIGISDLDKLGIIFSEKEIETYSLRNNDMLDLSDMFLIEGVKNGK